MLVSSDRNGQALGHHDEAASSFIHRRIVADLYKRCDSRAIIGFTNIGLRNDGAIKNVGGLDAEIVNKISNLHNDFGLYTEVEAHSLMLSGYVQTEQRFMRLQKASTGGRNTANESVAYNLEVKRSEWLFLSLEAIACLPTSSSDPRRRELAMQLAAGSGRYPRFWNLESMSKRNQLYLFSALAVTIAIVAVLLLQFFSDVSEYWQFGLILLIVLVIGFDKVWRWLSPEKAPAWSPRRFITVLASFFGSRLQLSFTNKILERGKLQRLLTLQ